MKDMRKFRYFGAVATGAAVIAACISGAAFVAGNRPAVTVTGPDHQRLTFVIAPGRSATFTLPKANDPIRIDIAKISTNGGVQNPSEVFSALVNVDGNHAGMSWIGTNSDGSQAAGTTISTKDITNLVCGASCLIASLKVKSVTHRTVILTANAATSRIREKYVINIWF
jgi:hypothetical protein